MPKVAIMMGSKSDLPIMEKAAAVLDEFGIDYDVEVISAHRTPEKMVKFVNGAPERGIKVFICGAGLSAALPGSVAAHTDLPVIGVPLDVALDGLDSLLSIAQMPPGVPVACVGVNNSRNAAYLAVCILSLQDDAIAESWTKFREDQRN